MHKQALVFGASGITGWAIVRECLIYPDSTTFSHVIGVCNRPTSRKDLLLKEGADRVDIQSGIDLSTNVNSLTDQLQAIPKLTQTTHVFYAASAGHGGDFDQVTNINLGFLTNAIGALTQLCPNLEFWSLQSGGKAYGWEFLGQDGMPWKVPLKESSLPVPEPFASKIFYNAQRQELARQSQGKRWTFCEVMPDIMSGHTPHDNAMGNARALGLFLALYAEVEGKGSEAVFPGPEPAWKALHSDSSQDIVARFHIFASLHPDKVSSQRFNISDEETVSWETLWPAACGYFNLKGVGPRDDGKLKGVEWMMANRERWSSFEDKYGLKEGLMESSTWDVLQLATVFAAFDRQYDLTKARSIGFEQSSTAVQGYLTAFDRMKEAGFIPH